LSTSSHAFVYEVSFTSVSFYHLTKSCDASTTFIPP
jgi:hypothetical protein